MPSIALYQPDIPQNLGASMRLAACMGQHLHVIEPCGFPWDDRKIRQSGMDYIDHLGYTRHTSWSEFKTKTIPARLILMTTKAALPYTDFEFKADDILIAGRESAGVPDHIHTAVDARVYIPMAVGLRSLNIVTATAMILGEAIRQNKN